MPYARLRARDKGVLDQYYGQASDLLFKTSAFGGDVSGTYDNISIDDLVITIAKLALTVYASKVEAEAGLENTKLMTPLRVAEAIAALAPGTGGISGSMVAIDPVTGTSKTYTFTDGLLTNIT